MARKRGNGEGCIRPLKNGYWEARITIGYNQTGKQIFKTFNGKTRTTVAKKLNEYIANQKSKEPEQASNDTVRVWLNKWYCDYVIEKVKTSTRVSYENNIKNHIIPYIGNIKIKELKKTDIESLYRKLFIDGRGDGKGGLSTKSVRNVHLCLRSALEEAFRNEYIIKNPASIVKVPAENRSKRKEIEIYTKDEQITLENACPNNGYGVAVKTVLNSGMRLGELLGLQWSDIDFEKKTITISKQLNRLKDYNPEATARTKLGMQDDTKTRTSNRTISISQNLAKILKNFEQQQKLERFKLGMAYKNLNMVFAREDGYYIDPATFRDNYKKIQKEAGVKHCTIHALRHTFATRALEAGVPIIVVSNILGHAGVQITMDTYSHVLPSTQEDAMETIEKYLSEG